MNQYRIKNLPKRIFLPSLVVCTVCFMFSSFSVLYAQTGTVWVNRTSAADIPWQSVTYGNGLFVAVSNVVQTQSSNQVMTSTNGINWEAHTAALPLQWNSVTYGNGTFVAVASSGSGNRVMTSTDGTNWTPRTSASDNLWTSVTYGNGVFVAVSVNDGSGNVMTSPDGITWTRQNAPRNNWQSVTYGKGLFVVVAESTSPAGSTAQGNRVMTSPDGITWTSRATPAENNWRSVTYGNGLFVAVSSTGSGNRVMTSPDGITWDSRATPAENNWRSVTYGNGLFVAVSNTGTDRVMTSPDGINWTTGTASNDNAWWSITYAHGIFVAVSIDGTGNRVMTSGTYADPLPVTLTSFNAKKQGEQALLSWFTAMEQDNKGFYVQRSERGNLFSNIGFVPARGNGTGAKYTFTDSFPLRGQNFYRLRQVDEDGTSSLSMVRVLDFSSILSNRLFPNPANDELFLNISTSINGTISLRISDLQGRVLKSWRYNQVSPTLQIDISELHNGNYFLEIWNNDRREVYPFVKQ